MKNSIISGISPLLGGLATGLKTVHENGKSLWIGQAGISAEEIEENDYKVLSDELIQQNYKPISLSGNEIDDFYLGCLISVSGPCSITLNNM